MEPFIAASLEDVYKTLSPEPLKEPHKLAAYYRESLRHARGGMKTERLERGLLRAYGATCYKAALGGHAGVGKTTELSCLTLREAVANHFQPIWFSMLSDLDPGSFKPFDVVLLMVIRLIEETAKPVAEGGAGQRPSDGLLKNLLQWFASETYKSTENTVTTGSVEAGAGGDGDSLWAQLLGLFAKVKGEVKYAVDRKTETVEYRLNRISSLVELANAALDECNELLRQNAHGREWLFIGDDFEKIGNAVEKAEELFVSYSSIFRDLRCHFIFVLPIALIYSDRATFLPFDKACQHTIPDTPVFTPDHLPHAEGRAALMDVLHARVAPELFAEGEAERLVAASGGNLRDLFFLVLQTADEALDRGEGSRGRMEPQDVMRSVNTLRLQYERALGESLEDRRNGITYAQKAERLVLIYAGNKDAEIADATLHALLRARAVQEFNGTGWFGVHPAVVSLLKEQKHLAPDAKGEVVAEYT